MRGKTLF